MAGTTANYGWPYPTASDVPAGHTQIQALADAADTTTKSLDNRLVAVEATAPIGTIVGDSGAISADASGSWNSATKVLSNVVCSFTAVAGAKYEIIANVSWTCATASNQDALGVVWAAGALSATSALAGAVGPRTHPDGTGYNATTIYGTFTAATSGAHNAGVIGWKPTGNTGASQIRANGTWAINRITVKRIG